MRYRTLRETDTIRLTDEVDMCRDGWRDDPIWKTVGDACPHMAGKHPSNPNYPAHTIYRRPVWVTPVIATDGEDRKERQ